MEILYFKGFFMFMSHWLYLPKQPIQQYYPLCCHQQLWSTHCIMLSYYCRLTGALRNKLESWNKLETQLAATMKVQPALCRINQHFLVHYYDLSCEYTLCTMLNFYLKHLNDFFNRYFLMNQSK